MDMEFENILKSFFAANIILPDQWLDDKKAEFIYNSNKLEGNRLKLADTHSIINDKMNFGNNASFKDILEVKGHIKALDMCIFMSKNRYPFTEKTLKLFNENLLSALWKFEEYYTSYKQQNQALGNYKVINNRIKFTLDGVDGVIEPMSNTATVDENMQIILKDNAQILSLVEQCAHLAFQIWINQPFPDGNKRTARLSVAYLLMLSGLPLISFKADGYHFNEGLLRSQHEKTLIPIAKVIATEVKQQLSEIMEMDQKLKTNKKPPKLGLGMSLVF